MLYTTKAKRLKVTNPTEHIVLPLSADDSTAQIKRRPVLKCLVHSGQELCFFCKDCDVGICRDCKLTFHQPYVTEDMASAAFRWKGQEANIGTTAKQQVVCLEKAIRQLARDDKELSRQKQKVTEEVNVHYDVILRWVNWSRAELLESIAASSESSASLLRAKVSEARNVLESLSGLVSTLSTTSDVGPEEIQASLLKEDIFDRFEKMGGSKDEIFLQLTSSPSALDQEMVRAYMGKINTLGECTLVEQQIKVLEERLKTTEQNLQKEFQSLKADLNTQSQSTTALEGKMKSAKDQLDTMQKRVAFDAWHNRDTFSIPGEGVLILDQVDLNIGKAYDTSTGIFTCPIPGLYDFQATIMTVDTGKKVNVGLFVNDGLQAQAIVFNKTDQSTVRSLKNLRKDDKVYLKNHNDDTVNFEGMADTLFSGFLIQAD